jgi:hypothetical protein
MSKMQRLYNQLKAINWEPETKIERAGANIIWIVDMMEHELTYYGTGEAANDKRVKR